MKDVACEWVLLVAREVFASGRGFFLRAELNDLVDPFLPHNDWAALNVNRRKQYHVGAP